MTSKKNNMEQNDIFEHINTERVYSNLISKVNPGQHLKQNYLPDLSIAIN